MAELCVPDAFNWLWRSSMYLCAVHCRQIDLQQSRK
eukprot:COSAG02_NODE_38750_length_425_cov_1.092025_1_plen_35_part_01